MFKLIYQNVYKSSQCIQAKQAVLYTLFSNNTGLPVFSLVAGWTSDARLTFVSTPIRGRRLSDFEDGQSTCVDDLGRRMKM